MRMGSPSQGRLQVLQGPGKFHAGLLQGNFSLSGLELYAIEHLDADLKKRDIESMPSGDESKLSVQTACTYSIHPVSLSYCAFSTLDLAVQMQLHHVSQASAAAQHRGAQHTCCCGVCMAGEKADE